MKILIAAAIAGVVSTTFPTSLPPAIAQGVTEMQFTPGSRVNVAVVNLTGNIVYLEQVQGTDPLPLRPGQEMFFDREATTVQNFSVVFWDSAGISLKADLFKLNAATLRIELRPGNRPPGDTAVYLLDDGRVQIF